MNQVNGNQLTARLHRLLEEQGHPFPTFAEQQIVPKIKEVMCYVARNYEEEAQLCQCSSSFEKTYQLPTGDSLVIYDEGFRLTAQDLISTTQSWGVLFHAFAAWIGGRLITRTNLTRGGEPWTIPRRRRARNGLVGTTAQRIDRKHQTPCPRPGERRSQGEGHRTSGEEVQHLAWRIDHVFVVHVRRFVFGKGGVR
ncbi:actin [Coelomomyces lativittatus]|nr:actin [Coelomomyces lativittatus]